MGKASNSDSSRQLRARGKSFCWACGLKLPLAQNNLYTTEAQLGGDTFWTSTTSWASSGPADRCLPPPFRKHFLLSELDKLEKGLITWGILPPSGRSLKRDASSGSVMAQVSRPTFPRPPGKAHHVHRRTVALRSPVSLLRKHCCGTWEKMLSGEPFLGSRLLNRWSWKKWMS